MEVLSPWAPGSHSSSGGQSSLIITKSHSSTLQTGICCEWRAESAGKLHFISLQRAIDHLGNMLFKWCLKSHITILAQHIIDFNIPINTISFAQSMTYKLTLNQSSVTGSPEGSSLTSGQLSFINGPWVISVLGAAPSHTELCGGQRGRQTGVVWGSPDLRQWFVKVHQTGVNQNLYKSPQWHQWQNVDYQCGWNVSQLLPSPERVALYFKHPPI